MSNPARPPAPRRWWRRLAKVPTSWHLLCAELELRAADTRALPAALRRARARNLDRLREYRRRGEFPDDPGAPEAYGPCFIDGEGRQCAVAHLLHASGAAAAALGVARVANHARLPDIDSDALDAWAASSGLTRAELARIQPSYPRDPGPLLPYYAALVAAVWVVGVLGVASMLLNARRLLRAYLGRAGAAGAGVFLGVALLVLSLLAYRLGVELTRHVRTANSSTPPHGQVQAYALSVALHGTAAFVVGVLSIVVAVNRYRLLENGPERGPRSLRRRRLPWLALSVLALAGGQLLIAVLCRTHAPLIDQDHLLLALFLAGVYALLARSLWRHWERVRRAEAAEDAERSFRRAPGPAPPSDTSPAGEGITTASRRGVRPPPPPAEPPGAGP